MSLNPRIALATSKLLNAAERVSMDYWTLPRIGTLKQLQTMSKDSPTFSRVRGEGVHSVLCTLFNDNDQLIGFPLKKSESTIGREDRDVGLFKLGGTKVSRLAATIVRNAKDPHQYEVLVHGKHGLNVNGVHLEPGAKMEITDGDILTFATLNFVFRILA